MWGGLSLDQMGRCQIIKNKILYSFANGWKYPPGNSHFPSNITCEDNFSFPKVGYVFFFSEGILIHLLRLKARL